MKKFLYQLLGLFFVGMAFLGVLLPGLPATPFLILATGCFAKSSPRLFNWLVNHPLFSPILKNWHETRTIPRRAKQVSLFMIVVVGGSSTIMTENIYLKIAIPLLLLFPIIFIARMKETERLQDSDDDHQR